METKRATLIARENNIKFPGPPLKRLSNPGTPAPTKDMAGYIGPRN